ncbi:hypothetical protein NGM10_08460 [Halorussus salilacus]|uniref:hypothetical protein n=1 Tax=Halorussus salilacus TaxID=2953750 RepID=UPI00209F2263|nr:hypothetical protein [Halorussus salilacus]USZ66768.1 hypothetical protein NGM10_08460 [Halorussus salilacus]
MRVRDAVEDDGEALGDLADAPAEVMRNVVHDRTVRVAEREPDDGPGDETEAEADAGTGTGADGEGIGADRPEVVGFVGFDAMPGTVRVTYLRGSRAARERLLEEPVRFARKEGMAVEVLVPESETETTRVVEEAGFEPTGDGPRFDGGRTLKYRLDPPAG